MIWIDSGPRGSAVLQIALLGLVGCEDFRADPAGAVGVAPTDAGADAPTASFCGSRPGAALCTDFESPTDRELAFSQGCGGLELEPGTGRNGTTSGVFRKTGGADQTCRLVRITQRFSPAELKRARFEGAFRIEPTATAESTFLVYLSLPKATLIAVLTFEPPDKGGAQLWLQSDGVTSTKQSAFLGPVTASTWLTFTIDADYEGRRATLTVDKEGVGRTIVPTVQLPPDLLVDRSTVELAYGLSYVNENRTVRADDVALELR